MAPKKGQKQGDAALPARKSSLSTSRTTTPTGTTDNTTAQATRQDSDSASVRTTTSIKGWSRDGTWPRKSIASTQIARESILGGISSGGRTADLSRFEPPKEKSIACVDQKHQQQQQRPSTSAGNLRARPSYPRLSTASSTNPSSIEPLISRHSDNDSDNVGQASKGDHVDGTPAAAVSEVPVLTNAAVATPSTGWFGWRSRHVAVEDVAARPVDEPAAQLIADNTAGKDKSNLTPAPNAAYETETARHDSHKGWFRYWSTAASSTAEIDALSQDAVPVSDVIETEAGSNSIDTQASTKPPAKGSSWGFWSRQSGNPESQDESVSETGELAVAGKQSQDNPIAAQVVEQPKARTKKIASSVQNTSSTAEAPSTKELLTSQLNSGKETAVRLKQPPHTASPAPSITDQKSSPSNLLVPELRSTFKVKESPGYIQQIAHILLRTRERPVKHVSLSPTTMTLRKCLAIGIHGLFPASFLRPVIGQPTGTSIRFANHAANAIQRWAESHGHECEVEKVALEGEGKIAERVDNLWKLLLNWVDHVRQADFILVACHSQGVPVALMLMAKLIEFKVVAPTTKIGVCAMAGVSLGPFVEFKANVRFFGGSTAELFEFADPSSAVSKQYEHSLRTALAHGVRVTYVGSIDDQLVSLESAIFSPVNHPYIYRAVFVDGRVHAPDFIAHLVGFALKLRNLGVSEHGLIRELSAPLAGSLYTGGGHSSLYDETRIYDLAVAFTLETCDIGTADLEVGREKAAAASGNPFQLPWSMRGLLEEEVVRTELATEVAVLLKQFDEWRPMTKGLKDVKYRLEAVRSKL